MFTSINSILLWGQRLQLKNNLTNLIWFIFFSHTDSLEWGNAKWLPAAIRAILPSLVNSPDRMPCFQPPRWLFGIYLIIRKWEIGTLSYSWTEAPVSLSYDGKDERDVMAMVNQESRKDDGLGKTESKSKGQRQRKSSDHRFRVEGISEVLSLSSSILHQKQIYRISALFEFKQVTSTEWELKLRFSDSSCGSSLLWWKV